MSKSITQDMAYRQSLMKYTEKYGVSRASRKYNKSRSYIYFWKQRWDGSVASLACQSRRPHSHPNQHTEAELKLIRDMRRRNPTLGMIELWLIPPRTSCGSCGHGTPAEAYKWNVSRQTTVLSLPTVFRAASVICRRYLKKRPPN